MRSDEENRKFRRPPSETGTPSARFLTMYVPPQTMGQTGGQDARPPKTSGQDAPKTENTMGVGRPARQ